jgi:hypothetical protein
LQRALANDQQRHVILAQFAGDDGPRGEHRIIWRCSRNGSAQGHVDIPHVVLLDKIALELKKLVPKEDSAPSESGQAQGIIPHDHQLLELENQLTRLEDAHLAGQWDLARYADRKKQIDAEIAKLRDQQIDTEIKVLERQAQTLHDLQSIPDLPAWLKTSDPAEINQRLYYLINHITVSEEEIQIVLNLL